MANFNVRVSDEMAARFDAWAAPRGGRSPALRHLIDRASSEASRDAHGGRLGVRPLKLTVRLREVDGDVLATAAADLGLTPNAWLAAVARARLQARPTFSRAGELALIAIQGELRRIGVNVNQIARALNTAVLEGRVLDTELIAVDDLRRELRGHMLALREGFEGNLAYWDIAP